MKSLFWVVLVLCVTSCTADEHDHVVGLAPSLPRYWCLISTRMATMWLSGWIPLDLMKIGRRHMNTISYLIALDRKITTIIMKHWEKLCKGCSWLMLVTISISSVCMLFRGFELRQFTFCRSDDEHDAVFDRRSFEKAKWIISIRCSQWLLLSNVYWRSTSWG